MSARTSGPWQVSLDEPTRVHSSVPSDASVVRYVRCADEVKS